MSYARWSEHSDVYVYAHYLGHVECCGCILDEAPDYHSADDVVAHMREHVTAGHKVPAHLLDPATYPPEDFEPLVVPGVTEP